MSGILGGGDTAGPDFPGFVPTQLGNVFLWLRPDLGFTLNGAHLSALANQSGSGDVNQNVSQGSASAQPTYIASDAAYNGQATLSYASASSQVLLSGTWSSYPAQPTTWVVVGNTDGALTQQGFMDFATQETATYVNALNQPSFFVTGALVGSAIGSAKVMLMTVANGASSAFYVNNSQTAVATGNVGTATESGVFSVGALAGPSSFLNGKIAEIIGCRGALVAADRATISSYLGRRYGIATS